MKFKEVFFLTQNVERLHRFYCNELGFNGKLEGKQLALSLKNTVLHFEEKKLATPYHFAINIPGNKAAEALEWLDKRVKILPFHGSKRVDFKSWNAESVYFHDPDGNIVEFIARKNLPEREENNFTPKMAMEVSEIGLPVAEIAPVATTIGKKTGAKTYDGDFDEFCAFGDERGMFIIINKEKKKWIPLDEPAPPSPFFVKLGNGATIRFSNAEIEIGPY